MVHAAGLSDIQQNWFANERHSKNLNSEITYADCRSIIFLQIEVYILPEMGSIYLGT